MFLYNMEYGAFCGNYEWFQLSQRSLSLMLLAFYYIQTLHLFYVRYNIQLNFPQYIIEEMARESMILSTLSKIFDKKWMIKTDGDPHILTHPKLSSLQQWIIPFSVKLVKKSLWGLHKTFWGTTKKCENKNLT